MSILSCSRACGIGTHGYQSAQASCLGRRELVGSTGHAMRRNPPSLISLPPFSPSVRKTRRSCVLSVQVAEGDAIPAPSPLLARARILREECNIGNLTPHPQSFFWFLAVTVPRTVLSVPCCMIAPLDRRPKNKPRALEKRSVLCVAKRRHREYNRKSNEGSQ